MKLNERIRQVWKNSGLTMSKFGERIGITNSSVSTMISGKSNPSDQTLKFISREFNISEEWLRTGTGEMYAPEAKDTVEELAREYGLDAKQTALLRRFLRLKPETWASLISAVEDVARDFAAEAVQNLAPIPPSERDIYGWTDADYHAELDRQLAEEKEAADESSDSGRGNSGMVIA